MNYKLSNDPKIIEIDHVNDKHLVMVELPNTNQRRKWDFFDWDQQYNDQEQDAIDLKWENWQNKWDQLNFLTFFIWNGIKRYVEHALRV